MGNSTVCKNEHFNVELPVPTYILCQRSILKTVNRKYKTIYRTRITSVENVYVLVHTGNSTLYGYSCFTILVLRIIYV